MKTYSKKRAAQERNLQKIRGELREQGHTRCFFFPHKYGFTFDHVVPRSARPDLIDCKGNLVPISEEAHYIITFRTAAQIGSLPRIREYLDKMRGIDEKYWRRFLTNHDLWEIYEENETRTDQGP
jgi:hypothetical protein